MPTRNADATWNGALRDGNGTFKTESGAVERAYSFSSRFEDGSGTNPEELIAAAAATAQRWEPAEAVHEWGPARGDGRRR